jgi:hypothetical protein
VEAAAGLLDGYFIPMAERVYGDASIPTAERKAMQLARHLRREQIREFKAREARRQIGGLLREATDMDAACAVLVEADLLRPRFGRAGGTKGREAKIYEVHPLLWARQS